jgi:hypothetical protein
MSIVEIVVARHLNAPDILHIRSCGPGSRSCDILEKLIEIASGAVVVVAAHPRADSLREAVAAYSAQAGFFPHGILPTDLLAARHSRKHSLVVPASGAIVEVAAVLEFHNAGLHP